MPLVKVDPRYFRSEERLAKRARTFPMEMSVWRWAAAAAQWVELPCRQLEWSRFEEGGKPLPGAPAGPFHAAILFLDDGRTAARRVVFRYCVVGEDGRQAEIVGVDPALEPRHSELMRLPDPTPEQGEEMRRIVEEAWRLFWPTLAMKRRLLLDAGARFDLFQVWPTLRPDALRIPAGPQDRPGLRPC